MSNSYIITTPTPSLKLSVILSPPDLDLALARSAALRLEPQLPMPTAWDYLVPPPEVRGATLLERSPNLATPVRPESLFVDYPDLLYLEYEGWEDAQLSCLRRKAHGNAFAALHGACHGTLESPAVAARLAQIPEFIAGLLLYCTNPSPESPVRQKLFSRAMENPSGAYFTAEAMITAEELPAVIAAVRQSSYLLFWVSRMTSFRKACCSIALSRHDLWSGLTLLLSDVPDSVLKAWFGDMSVKAFDCPKAAAAALTLFPEVRPELRTAWISTCVGDPRCAYETARYANAVLGRCLPIEHLRKVATLDIGRFWFGWWRDVEPHRAQEALDYDAEADLLWACELLDACSLKPDALSRRIPDSKPIAKLFMDFLKYHDRKAKA